MKRKPIVFTVIAIALVAAAAWGPMVSNVERPKYEAVLSAGNIEIRDYPSMIVAEAVSNGQREDAINDGFRKIADYIFGGNKQSMQIAMTAPVTQQADAAQTAADGVWKVRFIMPASYTLDTLPPPNNNEVTLRKVDGQRFAVIRFSGMATAASLEEELAKLRKFMSGKNLTAQSAPVYAFYNPPWTLPFLKRNEIMIETSR